MSEAPSGHLARELATQPDDWARVAARALGQGIAAAVAITGADLTARRGGSVNDPF